MNGVIDLPVEFIEIVGCHETAGESRYGGVENELADSNKMGQELARILELLDGPGWLADGAGVIIERSAAVGPPSLPTEWHISWERVFGDTLVVLAGPDADDPTA